MHQAYLVPRRWRIERVLWVLWVGTWLLPVPLSAETSAAFLARADAMWSGVPGKADEMGARRLYEAAAAGGDASALCRLTERQFSGFGVFSPPDPAASQRMAPLLPVLEEKAAAGDNDAAFCLAASLLFGIGRPASPARAAALLESAAQRGHLFSQQTLGWAYATGSGVSADAALAKFWYQKAIDAGSCVAQADLGRRWVTGNPGLEAAPARGMALLEKAVECGVTSASLKLADILLKGIAGFKDPARGEKLLSAAAERGSLDAAHDLGLAYEDGSLPRDDTKAFRYFAQAAQGGHASALNYLGFHYAHGLGVKQNSGKALVAYYAAINKGDPWAFDNLLALTDSGVPKETLDQEAANWRRAAESGNGNAAALFAFYLFYGEGSQKADPKGATAWAQKAIDRGSPWGMIILAVAASTGRGASKNPAEAEHWYGLAAEAGLRLGMTRLAYSLLKKDEVREREQGLFWLRKAAEANFQGAQVDLAHIFDLGTHGIKPNAEEAEHWYRKLARNGNLEAVGYLYFREHSSPVAGRVR